MRLTEPALVRITLARAAETVVVGTYMIDAILRVQQVPSPLHTAILLALMSWSAAGLIFAELRVRLGAFHPGATRDAAGVLVARTATARHPRLVAAVPVRAVMVGTMPHRRGVVENLDVACTAIGSADLVLRTIPRIRVDVCRVCRRNHGFGAGRFGTSVILFTATAISRLLETVGRVAGVLLAKSGVQVGILEVTDILAAAFRTRIFRVSAIVKPKCSFVKRLTLGAVR